MREAILIRPLTRMTGGRPYKRLPEVEAEILELLSLDVEERMERLTLASPSAPGYVRPETLVYFLREEARSNRIDRFHVLYRLVMKRYLAFFRPADRYVGEMKHTDGALEDLRRHAADRFIEKITQDRRQGDDRLDIYEVVFGFAAVKDRSSARRAVYRHVDREEALNPVDDGRTASQKVEEAAAMLTAMGDTTNSDASDDRKRVLAAIDTLPEKYRRVATMTMNNIPTESTDLDALTISKALNCTPKTARARRDAAVQMIQKALGLKALT